MHLNEPYVPVQADHLGQVVVKLDDRDGTDPNFEIRVDVRLLDADGQQVTDRMGDPDYMPQDWKDRVQVLLQEFRTATAAIHNVDAAPPPQEEE